MLLPHGEPVLGRLACGLTLDIVERADPLQRLLGDVEPVAFQTSWKSRRRCAQHAASHTRTSPLVSSGSQSFLNPE